MDLIKDQGARIQSGGVGIEVVVPDEFATEHPQVIAVAVEGLAGIALCEQVLKE